MIINNLKLTKILNWITFILVVIGGINWGLVGLFNYDLVSAIFGQASLLTRLIFDLVGLSAIYMIAVGGQMMSKPSA